MNRGFPSRLPGGLRLLVLAGALLAGCGGGNDMWAGPGVGGTGAYASGPISGFGSVIVNGVRFEDERAQVFDDDGVQRSRDELALGMTVEVLGSPPTEDAAGRRSEATEIRYGAQLLGAVDAVDAAAGTLKVFGITVKVKSTTVFAGASGLAGLPQGGVVEVHGLRDDSGAVVATRIELKAPSLAAYAAVAGNVLRITAQVTSVSGQDFRVQTGEGTLPVSSPTPLPGGVAAGATVKLRLLPQASAGVFTAERIVVQSAHVPEGAVEVEIEGFVTAFVSASSFQVNGVSVSTGAGTDFRHGAPAQLKQGARIEVEGVMANGVLVASKLDFKVRDDNDNSNDASGGGSGSGGADTPFELHGHIGALDTAAQTFKLRGQTVRYSSQTVFEAGTAADLSNGQQLEVRGVLDSDGSRLLATLIRIGG